MIEQVAKAILQAEINNGEADNSTTFKSYIPAARAAIAAMREPTEEMVNATGLWNGAASSFWKEMIDVALSGNGQTAVQAKEE